MSDDPAGPSGARPGAARDDRAPRPSGTLRAPLADPSGARPGEDPRLAQWAADQRALAQTLGLSLEDWLDALTAAAERRTGLTAAVIGAATSRGLGLGVLAEIDGPELAERARGLIDPRPPRVADPVLAEAIRRSDDLDAQEGRGAARLRRRAAPTTPEREVRPLGPSASIATPDAPGGEER